MQFSTIFIFLALAALIWGIQRYRGRARRNRLLHEPLSPEHIRILENNVPLYTRLPKELHEKLQGCINWFLDEKVFVGREGLEITDEIRLIVAANACILIVNNRERYFSGFETILVYPDTYIAREVSYDGMVEVHKDVARAGESWYRGPIVLSLTDVVRGSSNEQDGHNVVLHEFAHKLDEENGVMDGLPVLRESAHYKEWAEVLTREYDEFLDRVDRGKNTVIDEYGIVSAPEFFAVATESFFEKSEQMRKRLPELYKQLQTFYGLDPAEW
ncbi:MAG: M90 family metallopeptidase [Candidatus Thiodiazotropha sp.]